MLGMATHMNLIHIWDERLDHLQRQSIDLGIDVILTRNVLPHAHLARLVTSKNISGAIKSKKMKVARISPSHP